jgi:hypothetical protein
MIVSAVLVVVCVWWAVFVPQIKQYEIHKREAKLKETLQAIMPPAGTRTGSVTTDHLTVGGGYNVVLLTATGVYSTTSDCESVKSHYKEGFARHGFTLRTQGKDARVDPNGISFSTPDCDASVHCTALPTQISIDTVIYTVTLNSTYALD